MGFGCVCARTQSHCAGAGSGHIIQLNASVDYQELLGFGAAFTDSAGIVTRSLSAAAGDKLMRSYWADEGLCGRSVFTVTHK